MSEPAPLLTAQALCKSYQSGDRRIAVLDGLDFVMAPQESCAIVGASGSGKTTLLQILGTLDRPDSGTLLFKGRDLLALSGTSLQLPDRKSVV